MPEPSSHVHVSVVHPFDPWKQGIGGFDTFLDAFLRCAPARWRLEVIGITRDEIARPAGRRAVCSFHGRPLEFLPVLHEPDPYIVKKLPLSLRFARSARLRRASPRGTIAQFHRFESLFAVDRGAARRSVCFLHNHPPELLSAKSDVRWRRFGPLFHRVLHRSLSKVDAVWGVDPRTPNWVADFSPHLAKNVFSQPVWADPEVFVPKTTDERERERKVLRMQLGLDESDLLCVFAGRLELQKDPLLLIDALHKVASNEPRLFLVIVGQGRLEHAIARRATGLGLQDRLKWLGWLSRERLGAIYRAADLSVCCSAFESGPRSVYESLACGCPVVSFDVGQVANVLTPLSDLGLLVSGRGAAPLATAMERVLATGRGQDLVPRCVAAVSEATPQSALAGLYEQYEAWLEEAL